MSSIDTWVPEISSPDPYGSALNYPIIDMRTYLSLFMIY